MFNARKIMASVRGGIEAVLESNGFQFDGHTRWVKGNASCLLYTGNFSFYGQDRSHFAGTYSMENVAELKNRIAAA